MTAALFAAERIGNRRALHGAERRADEVIADIEDFLLVQRLAGETELQDGDAGGVVLQDVGREHAGRHLVERDLHGGGGLSHRHIDPQGTDVAKYAVQKLGKKRFAIINDSTAYGEPLAEVVRKTVLSEGAQVVSFDGVNADDTDFRALLTRIRADNPDVLFFGGIYNEAGLVARQAREVGLNVTFLATDGSFGQTFINIAGTKAAEGAVMSFIAPAETTSPTTRAFAERFRKQYGSIKAFAPLGYDSTNILFAGITNAEDSTGQR